MTTLTDILCVVGVLMCATLILAPIGLVALTVAVVLTEVDCRR